jgi:hypothetical protein
MLNERTWLNSFVSIFEQYTNLQNGDANVSHSTEATVDEGAAPAARTSRSRIKAAAIGKTCSVEYPRPEGACQYPEL